jgi:O-antigen/teichoic acid export membrane protein
MKKSQKRSDQKNIEAFKQIKQLGAESVIYGISGTIAKSIGIFLIPIYTRIFSPSDYGIIALITTLMGLIGMFIALGLDNSSARWFYDTDLKDDRKYTISSWFWCQLITGSVITGGVVLFSPIIARTLLGSEKYTILIVFAVVATTLETFSRVLSNWLRYQRRAWSTTIFSTASALGTIALIILFVIVFRRGLFGIYSAKLIAIIISAVAAASMLRSWIRPAFFSWNRLKEMLVYGLPLVPAAIASWITLSSDRFILQLFHNTSEVGLYSVAATLASGVALIIGAFQKAWGPFAFSIYKEKESVEVYSEVLTLFAFLSCFLGTAVSLFTPLLLSIFTTPDYFGSASCVPFLVFSYIAIGATYILGIGSSIVKRSKPIAIGILLGSSINLVLNFILIPAYGKEGAAVATLISYIAVLFYRYPVSQSDYRIPYRIWVTVICFCFSWLLILIDHLFISAQGYIAFWLRTMMCSLFIPLGFIIGIIKPVHAKRLLLSLRSQ